MNYLARVWRSLFPPPSGKCEICGKPVGDREYTCDEHFLENLAAP